MERLTIRKIRLVNEATQEEFAELLNLSTTAYINKELGKQRFYFDEVRKICNKYSIDMNTIDA